MTFPTFSWTSIPGLCVENKSNAPAHWGFGIGRRLRHFGQSANTSAGNVANQGMGTAAIGALAALATTAVTITDSLITANSLVYITIGEGTTTPAAGTRGYVTGTTRVPGTGSVVVDVRNIAPATATLATDYVIHYWVVN